MINQLLTDPDGRERSIRQAQARTVLALARVEAVRLLSHPLVWLGVALGGILAAGADSIRLTAPILHRDDAYVALACAPVAAGTLLAANLAVTRARRNDADELLDPTPTVPSRRTIAHLVSLIGPILIAVAVAAAWLGWAGTRPGAVGTPGLMQSLHGPALVFTAGAIGVMVGRWIPGRLTALLTLLVLGLPFLVADAPGWLRWLAWFRLPQDHIVPEFTAWPTTEHLIYLVGIGLIASCVAQLRHGPNQRRIAAAAVAVALVASATFAQSRIPAEDTVAAAFTLAEDPSQRHECTTSGDVTSCVWPTYTKLADLWTPLLAGAVEPLPADVRPELRVEMRPSPHSLSNLVSSISDPDVRSRWHQECLRLIDVSPEGERDIIVAGPRWPAPKVADETTFVWALAAATRASGFDTEPTVAERRATADETAVYARHLVNPTARTTSERAVSPWWVRGYFGAFVLPDQASRKWAFDDLDLGSPRTSDHASDPGEWGFGGSELPTCA